MTIVASDYAFSYAQVFGFSLQYTQAGGKINYLWSPFGTSDYSSLIAQIPALAGRSPSSMAARMVWRS